MYNSAIKGKTNSIIMHEFKEIKNKIFYNDMTKNYIHEVFKSCDCIYSEISWNRGFPIFNERAKNSNHGSYKEYLENINKLINEVNVPSFIIAGKSHIKYFNNAEYYPIKFYTPNKFIGDVLVFIWNYDIEYIPTTTIDLIIMLSGRFNKVLDFSCGYGEHLLKFKDFVGCDIDKNCLSYLAYEYERRLENCK